MNQIILPLIFEVKLQENDISFHIQHLLESVLEEKTRDVLHANKG